MQKRNKQRKQLNQLIETLHNFITGNVTNGSVMEDETSDQQNNGQHNVFERFVDSASQNQVTENKIDDKNRRFVDHAVLTVENCMHKTILTVMEKVVLPRIEMAVKSITVSLEHRPKSEVFFVLIRDISWGMLVTLHSGRPLAD